MTASAAARVEVGGRTVALSNLDKVLYPRTGFTKADVVDYYARVAPAMLPHLADRPLSLRRFPDGVEAEGFYQKACPSHRPPWVRTEPVWSEGRGENLRYCLCDDLPSLVWLANLAALELHAFLHRVPRLDAAAPGARYNLLPSPTVVAFDLDPGPPADVLACADVALRLRSLLDGLGLASFPKTSGGKGLQVYVPLNTPGTSYEGPYGTKAFARAVAEALARERPRLVTSNMRKDLRKGRVFVDWSQNDDHKTTVSVYSLRAGRAPTVSTPLAWGEVEGADDPAALAFGPGAVLARVERGGDAFADVLTRGQALPRA